LALEHLGHAERLEHFLAGLDYQEKLVRFLENHDEPRAAATFPPDIHEAAAVITCLSPGMRFFHQGQFEGRTKRISPHLVRAPAETADENLKRFYERLLAVLRHDVVRNGTWRQLECVPAWDGNGSCDSFLAFGWEGSDGQRLLVAVNYAPNQSQCYVRIPYDDLREGMWRLNDQVGEAAYEREGTDLIARGLHLDCPPGITTSFTSNASSSLPKKLAGARIKPPLRVRSFRFDPRCRSQSAKSRCEGDIKSFNFAHHRIFHAHRAVTRKYPQLAAAPDAAAAHQAELERS
jgi:hypothetical protein